MRTPDAHSCICNLQIRKLPFQKCPSDIATFLRLRVHFFSFSVFKHSCFRCWQLIFFLSFFSARLMSALITVAEIGSCPLTGISGSERRMPGYINFRERAEKNERGSNKRNSSGINSSLSTCEITGRDVKSILRVMHPTVVVHTTASGEHADRC